MKRKFDLQLSFRASCATVLALGFAAAGTALGQPVGWTIETVAGRSDDGGPATEARLHGPRGVAVEATGNLYIADTVNHRVHRVDAATGVISTVAGTGEEGFGGDGGPATEAQLFGPSGIAVDASGKLYIADAANDRVRRVDTDTGAISTVAGTDRFGFGGDGGLATEARLWTPSGVDVDASGNLFIADSSNHRVRRVDAATGIISTVAGTGRFGFTGDGDPAIDARLDGPNDVAVDATGNLYIADVNNYRIRRVDAATGLISTVAGTGSYGFGGDGGPATEARLSLPERVAVDATGNLYIADAYNHRIRRVDAATGLISTVAGTGSYGLGGDSGPATEARLAFPDGLTVDATGVLYIADRENDRVRQVDVATGVISTFAGTGDLGDRGPATEAQLGFPGGVAVDATGNLYIADKRDHRVRRVDTATGVVSTFAGTGENSFGGDGEPASEARLGSPRGIAVDATGNLYIADGRNERVRRVDAATGVISTVAGSTRLSGFRGDGGPAIEAWFWGLHGVAVDASGNLYITDSGNDRVRRVDAATGVISTVVGTGHGGFGGDGGPAVEARLRNPRGIAVDVSGNLFIADAGNHRIRRVDGSTDIISTVVGNWVGFGNGDFGGDGGPATEALLDSPEGVAVDLSGDLFIADAGNGRVRRVDAATGVISTVAGTGEWGFSGDGGPAAEARLAGPKGVAVDAAGNIYVADTGNRRVRRLVPTYQSAALVPLFPSASDPLGRQGFVRVINRTAMPGRVSIEAVDDYGVGAGPVGLELGANETVHFNSKDLEEGNVSKGLPEGVGSGTGDWRLSLDAELDVDVLAYIRTEDGFVTSMHDAARIADGAYPVPLFNPASNFNQVSLLRLVNPGTGDAEVRITGIDDDGGSPGTAVELDVPAGLSATLSASDLEKGTGENGALGDGKGKWRLRVESDEPLAVMSLLSSPTGHLTNLSTFPPAPGEDGAHTVPLFPSASDPLGRQGFLRVVNRSDEAASVGIEAFDDGETVYEALTLSLDAGETAQFNSDDLELGNAAKGLEGSTGSGTGDWRLAVSSEADIDVLAYIRTKDGFVTSMHDLAPTADGLLHHVAFLNPGSNYRQVSQLRLVNPGTQDAAVTIKGIDDAGASPGGPVALEVPAGASATLSASQLEEGGDGLAGRLGDGKGKWRLRVESDRRIMVMSLLSSPTGHLTNLSTAPTGTME